MLTFMKVRSSLKSFAARLINVGAFFGVATSYSEKNVGYWLAYLLPCILYLLCPLVLLFAYKRTLKTPPQGSQLENVFRIVGIATKRNGIMKLGRTGFLDAAKPSKLAAEGYDKEVPWTDKFVEDVGRTFYACQIFMFFPFYNLNDGGIGNIQTSQGSTMITNGAPNGGHQIHCLPLACHSSWIYDPAM